jgi:hypothetical protein
MVGYLALVLLLVTVALAAETDYNKGVLRIKLWAVLLSEALIVVGVFPRVHMSKMGFNTDVFRLPAAGQIDPRPSRNVEEDHQ